MSKQQVHDLIARAEPYRGQTLSAMEVIGKNKGKTSSFRFTGITNAVGFGSPMSYEIYAILTSPEGVDGTASLKSVIEHFESLSGATA